jgi:hypothetical protein
VREQTYRLYNCQRCGALVTVCGPCDRGRIYCQGECAAIRKRESLRRAGARYQNTPRGARKHAARQRLWRGGHAQEVTHGGFTNTASLITVPTHSMVREQTDAHEALQTPPSTPQQGRVVGLLARRTRLVREESLRDTPRCDFCHAPLPRLARVQDFWGRLLH